MAKVIIYIKPTCPFCVKAKKLLESKKVKYTQIDVSKPSDQAAMAKITGGRTVPQVIIDDKVIGGCDSLYSLDANDKLDSLLKKINSNR